MIWAKQLIGFESAIQGMSKCGLIFFYFNFLCSLAFECFFIYLFFKFLTSLFRRVKESRSEAYYVKAITELTREVKEIKFNQCYQMNHHLGVRIDGVEGSLERYKFETKP